MSQIAFYSHFVDYFNSWDWWVLRFTTLRCDDHARRFWHNIWCSTGSAHELDKCRKLRVRYCRQCTDIPSRTQVQHSRPGQRRLAASMCSVVKRCVVVRCMSWQQPQRALSQRRLQDVRRWCRVAVLERRSVLAEIHWDEDQTVQLLNCWHYSYSFNLNLS